MQLPCDIVILAAGSSSRLGSPKQLLKYKKGTLLQHSIDQALASAAGQVIVVVNDNGELIPLSSQHNKVSIVVNAQWQEGMAASIRCGLNYLLKQGDLKEPVLFMVCDQPYVNTGLLNKLITLQKETGSSIAASEYAGVKGIPAIFTSLLFPELLNLKGDSGAKKIIMRHADSVVTVPFPFGDIDIDTVSDYEQLKAMNRT